MSNKKNIQKNLIFSVLSQVITIALGVIIPRIIIVGYGSEVNGLISSVTQFIGYLTLFESGIQSVALKSLYKPVHDSDWKGINGVLAAVHKNYQRIGVMYFFALLALSLGYPLVVDVSAVGYLPTVLIILFSGLGNVIMFFAQGKYRIFLQASGKTYINTNVQTVITIANNLAKIILLELRFDVTMVIMASFVISLGQAVYISAYIKKHCKQINLKEQPNYQALEQKNAMLVHQISSLVFQNTDTLIITMVLGLKAVSVYTVYKLLTNHISLLLQSTYTSGSYYLGQTYHTSKSQFVKLADTVEVYYGALVYATYVVAAWLLVPCVELYTQGAADAQYQDWMLAILFVVSELLSLTRIPMQNTINYAGAFRDTLPQTILESVINIVVSLVGVYLWGVYGVLVGKIVALLYRSLEIACYSNIKLLDRKPWKTLSVYGVNTLTLLGVYFLFTVIHLQVNGWVDFLVAGVILYPLALVIFFAVGSLLFRKEFGVCLQLVKSLKHR